MNNTTFEPLTTFVIIITSFTAELKVAQIKSTAATS